MCMRPKKKPTLNESLGCRGKPIWKNNLHTRYCLLSAISKMRAFIFKEQRGKIGWGGIGGFFSPGKFPFWSEQIHLDFEKKVFSLPEQKTIHQNIVWKSQTGDEFEDEDPETPKISHVVVSFRKHQLGWHVVCAPDKHKTKKRRGDLAFQQW